MHDLKLFWTLLLVAVVAFASGCGDDTQGAMDAGPDSDSDSDSDSDTDSDTDSDSDTGYDAGPDSGPGASLTGRWGELLNLTIIQTGIPIVNEQWVASRNWFLVDIVTDGEGNLTAYERLCAIRIKLRGMNGLNLGNQSLVSQNFIDHMPVLERHVSLEDDVPGTPWVSDTVYDVRGANLCNGNCNPFTDPECDELPPNHSSDDPDNTSCDLECTGEDCDQDEDGHPGVTNTLQGALNCDVYVVQRWWCAFDGEIIDEDTIAGAAVDNFSEQPLLDASNWACQQGNPGTASEDCPPHQYFKMVRLPDDATCADVMALTDCDEDPGNCDTNDVQVLDPLNDMPTDPCD
jgi:hypothetical protein